MAGGPRRRVSADGADGETRRAGDARRGTRGRSVGEAQALATKYAAAPAPIDFAAYKGKVDDQLLALFEKEY